MTEMVRIIILISILAVTAVFCSGCGPTVGETVVSIQHEGHEREYLLYVPSSYRHGQDTPLLLAFHHTNGNAAAMAGLSELNAWAEQYAVLVAYPQGLLLDGIQVFDAGLRDFSSAPRDDVDFARAIVDDVAGRASVDRKRVYSTGFSNGARMSYRIACEAADLVAAIAPVAGVLSLAPEQCDPSRPVPAIHFHGTADTIAPYYEAGGYSTMSVPDMFSLWAEKTECTDEPAVDFQQDDITCESYDTCSEGAEVVLCTITDGRHSWPEYLTETIEAGPGLLDFLLRFQLP